MTNLVLLIEIKDGFQMSRISDGKVTSVFDYDITNHNKQQILETIENYRVNDFE
jgi:hypothetical protein